MYVTVGVIFLFYYLSQMLRGRSARTNSFFMHFTHASIFSAFKALIVINNNRFLSGKKCISNLEPDLIITLRLLEVPIIIYLFIVCVFIVTTAIWHIVLLVCGVERANVSS